MSKKGSENLHKYGIRGDGSQTRSNKGFISFSNYLKKKQEQEMKILQKLDYKYTGHKETSNMEGQMFKFMKNKEKDNIKKSPKNKPQKTIIRKLPIKNTTGNNTDNNQYEQIDQEAVIINNKLIYLKQQPSSIVSNDQLLHLLKQNNLSNKDYLRGKKEEILRQINQNQSEQENQIIKDYIMRNMNEQNNGQVLVMDWFYQVKHSLFS